ncbi:MAG: hypothetical protein RL376_1620, partial [Verrucomicrobiota bacterium]
MSQLPIVPPGIHLSAVATSSFTLESGIGAKSGRPWSKVVGRGVAGEQFV